MRSDSKRKQQTVITKKPTLIEGLDAVFADITRRGTLPEKQ